MPPLAVRRVSHDLVAEVREMPADLVAAAGAETRAHHRETMNVLDRLEFAVRAPPGRRRFRWSAAGRLHERRCGVSPRTIARYSLVPSASASCSTRASSEVMNANARMPDWRGGRAGAPGRHDCPSWLRRTPGARTKRSLDRLVPVDQDSGRLVDHDEPVVLEQHRESVLEMWLPRPRSLYTQVGGDHVSARVELPHHRDPREADPAACRGGDGRPPPHASSETRASKPPAITSRSS